MDLYQMKYENIADRLKRLASPPPTNPLNASANALPAYRHTPNPNKRDGGNESEARSKYQQALKYAKTTLETDHSAD
jgi:hypothetical protein